MKRRARFPRPAIYAVVGGLALTHYLCEADRHRYRYAAPARVHSPTAYVGDCWIVDRLGFVNPGTARSPVTVLREVLGRRVAAMP